MKEQDWSENRVSDDDLEAASVLLNFSLSKPVHSIEDPSVDEVLLRKRKHAQENASLF